MLEQGQKLMQIAAPKTVGFKMTACALMIGVNCFNYMNFKMSSGPDKLAIQKRTMQPDSIALSALTTHFYPTSFASLAVNCGVMATLGAPLTCYKFGLIAGASGLMSSLAAFI
jgi:hypothetical protein